MLELIPMTLREANAFVEQHHRHHKPVVGHKFSIGVSDGEKVVGVAIVGRPVGRFLDDGWTLEVTRLCTDGTHNACSMLYAAAWRAARAMGYRRVVTYILESETGASLKAAGWKCIGKAGGLRWTGKRRPEVDLYPAQMKIRFERTRGGMTVPLLIYYRKDGAIVQHQLAPEAWGPEELKKKIEEYNAEHPSAPPTPWRWSPEA